MKAPPRNWHPSTWAKEPQLADLVAAVDFHDLMQDHDFAVPHSARFATARNFQTRLPLR